MGPLKSLHNKCNVFSFADMACRIRDFLIKRVCEENHDGIWNSADIVWCYWHLQSNNPCYCRHAVNVSGLEVAKEKVPLSKVAQHHKKRKGPVIDTIRVRMHWIGECFQLPSHQEYINAKSMLMLWLNMIPEWAQNVWHILHFVCRMGLGNSSA